jgi:hypothetical protein
MTSSRAHLGHYVSWLAILLLWIGGWSLIDVTVQYFIKPYFAQMLIYAAIFVLGTTLFFVSKPVGLMASGSAESTCH